VLDEEGEERFSEEERDRGKTHQPSTANSISPKRKRGTRGLGNIRLVSRLA